MSMPHHGKRALVIAHEPDGLARQIEVRLVERGLLVDTHVVTSDPNRPNEPAPWPDTGSYDMILPMGSVRSLTRKYEIDAWVHAELDLLRKVHEAGVPVLGVCFGGQLLAEALGGSVEAAPVSEVGWYDIEPEAGQVNPAGRGPWMEWHHDRFTPPAGAHRLATTENAVQLFRVGTTVGTQFHPEVDLVQVSGWVAACTADYLAEHAICADSVLAEMREHEGRNIVQCHAFVDWFLDEVAFPGGARE